MLEPNGPLPPEIYWRRRAFAIGIVVVVLVLAIWLVLTATRGGGSPGGSSAAASSSSSVAPKPAEPTTGSSATPDAGGGPRSSATGGGAVASTPTGGVVAGDQCSDQSLAVKVTVEQPTYKAGEQPVFGIVITNISPRPCSRDMGSGLQQVSVWSLDGQRKLWSSTDCYPDGQPDPRTLNGGEQAAFTVTWSGSTSQPHCAGDRVPVPAGAYSVVAQLGAVQSFAEPFNIA